MSVHNPRRAIMHAAVAAGGASAALMHYSIACDDEAEIRAAADECLEPVLRSALLIIDAAGILPGETERATLQAAIVAYVDRPQDPREGTCRICGCTDTNACAPFKAWDGTVRPCAWADEERTLCDNPSCLEAAGKQQTGEGPVSPTPTPEISS